MGYANLAARSLSRRSLLDSAPKCDQKAILIWNAAVEIEIGSFGQMRDSGRPRLIAWRFGEPFGFSGS